MKIVLALLTYPLRRICFARMQSEKIFICFLRSSTSAVLSFYLYVFYLLGCCICDIAVVHLLILDSSFIYYHFDYLLSLFDLFKCIISCLLSVQNPLLAILNLRIDWIIQVKKWSQEPRFLAKLTRVMLSTSHRFIGFTADHFHFLL